MALEALTGRIEERELEKEMRSSYLDYAMSVIVGRALPDVRDGLKPVHRRVLYAMHDIGLQPTRAYRKCAFIVGEVMGKYHPHGDSAIYDTLVRMAQEFSLRYTLVDGQGNFGSIDDDPAAAMRYCVAGDTRVATTHGTVRIDSLAAGMEPNSDNDVDLEVLDRLGRPVHASKLFHSGEHPTLRLRTAQGHELTGTQNHPVLCLVDMEGVPLLLWKLLEEIKPGDRVLISRTAQDLEASSLKLDEVDAQLALLAGAFVSEGWISPKRAGFNNVDEEFFDAVLSAYDAVVGGSRAMSPPVASPREASCTSSIFRTSTRCVRALLARSSARQARSGCRSSSGGRAVRSSVLSCERCSPETARPRCCPAGRSRCRIPPTANSSPATYSCCCWRAPSSRESAATRRVSSRSSISNRRDARLFARHVGFIGHQAGQTGAGSRDRSRSRAGRSATIMSRTSPTTSVLIAARGWTERDWLRRHNVDRIERWEQGGPAIMERIESARGPQGCRATGHRRLLLRRGRVGSGCRRPGLCTRSGSTAKTTPS